MDFRAFRIIAGGYPPNRIEAYYRMGSVEAIRCLDVSIPDAPTPIWWLSGDHMDVISQYAQDVFDNRHPHYIQPL